MKILILSGKKQSGKDTSVDFLESIGVPTKRFSFAEELKRTCVEILGVEREKIYGTDAQKNSLTHLRWENMPGVITTFQAQEMFSACLEYKMCENYSIFPSPFDSSVINGYWRCPLFNDIGIIVHEPGPMTGREVQQYVGTEVFRRMYGDCWVANTWKRIDRWFHEYVAFSNISYDAPDPIICLTDCRFPNECLYLSNRGAKSIRFTRQIFEDNHMSEIALDDFKDFDYIIDNKNMNIEEKNNKVMEILKELEWIK